MPYRVVLIQSDMKSTQPLARFFSQRGDEVWQAWELGQAWTIIEQARPDLVLMDLHFASSEWVSFLRRLKREHPAARVIMTNQYPDLQREILAREQDVRVFLRQPFSAKWIEQAVKRLDEEPQPVGERAAHDASPFQSPVAQAVEPRPAGGKKPAQGGEAGQPVRKKAKPAGKGPARSAPPVRAVRMPVRVKITLPYLMLVLVFALAGAYLVSRVILESEQDRFLNQLIATGRQAMDWMVREEDRMLGTLRLVANTQGMAEAIDQGDAEALRALVLPVALNAGEELVEVLNPAGVSVLSLRRASGSMEYQSMRGEAIFAEWPFVRSVTGGVVDYAGDKFAGVGQAPWGDAFYVSGPVYHPDGSLAGVVLIGTSLPALVRDMHEATLGHITLYDLSGQPVASTLFTSDATPVKGEMLLDVLRSANNESLSREVTVSTLRYTEILSPWYARQAPQGFIGVALAEAYLVRTSRVTQVQIFLLATLGIFLVLLVGVYLANLITRPLVRLARASSEVAQGNLEVKVDATGDDEVAVLAQSFNYMVAGLQEGSIYRDLLGRTVSPEVREQLRQTFTSGSLRLEGQQAVATVLMTDIRGFTPISEAADPATVFQWLNEYFAQVVPVIAVHGGVVNKFDGDAMLAFFGILPRMLSPRQSAAAACQAALEILQAIDKLNSARERRGEPPLVTGVGVNTGLVMAGGLGTSDRLHYTIIGDTVNTAQRIESLTRTVLDCSGVLISQSAYDALGKAQARFRLVPLGMHSLKGKSEPLAIYQLTAPLEVPGDVEEKSPAESQAAPDNPQAAPDNPQAAPDNPQAAPDNPQAAPVMTPALAASLPAAESPILDNTMGQE